MALAPWPFSIAKRCQQFSAGVSPQRCPPPIARAAKRRQQEVLFRPISAAASRLQIRVVVAFRGLTPTAICCRRFATQDFGSVAVDSRLLNGIGHVESQGAYARRAKGLTPPRSEKTKPPPRSETFSNCRQWSLKYDIRGPPHDDRTFVDLLVGAVVGRGVGVDRRGHGRAVLGRLAAERLSARLRSAGVVAAGIGCLRRVALQSARVGRGVSARREAFGRGVVG